MSNKPNTPAVIALWVAIFLVVPVVLGFMLRAANGCAGRSY